MGKLTGLFGAAERFVRRNAPQILTGLGIAGFFSAIGMSISATPEAARKIEAKKKEMGVHTLSVIETVKVAGPCYIPAAIAAATSTACLIGANSVNGKKTAALATAYHLSETALSEYREKVIEKIGEKREGEIRDEVAKSRLREVVGSSEIIIPGQGNIRCFDSVSEKLFFSDYDTILGARNDFNHRLNSEMYLSMNDFLYLLNVSYMPTGDDIGWNKNNPMDISLVSELINKIPYLVIRHNVLPTHKFREY
jgi:hypothetical protein